MILGFGLELISWLWEEFIFPFFSWIWEKSASILPGNISNTDSYFIIKQLLLIIAFIIASLVTIKLHKSNYNLISDSFNRIKNNFSRRLLLKNKDVIPSAKNILVNLTKLLLFMSGLLLLFYVWTLWISPYYREIFLILVGVLLAVVLIFTFKFLYQQFASSLLVNRMGYSAGKFQKNDWIDLLKKSNPRKQREIIVRTSQHSLNLTALEFLGLLKEVRSIIKEDPAQSAYWEKRNQLEAILKQERMG